MSSPPSPAMSPVMLPEAAANEEEDEETKNSGGVKSSHSRAFSYGEAEYWDARYVEEGGAPYDWYQRYAALRPFVRGFIPSASRLLMVGCGSALMSEDMVNDGYVEIMNIDISSVVIEMMKKRYFHIPQLTYAPLSAAQMILEVDRLLRPGGVFMLITYGDPSVRIPHLNQPGCQWKIILYILPRPGFKGRSRRSVMDPVPLTERGQLPVGFVPEDPDSHFIYVCKKIQGLTATIDPPTVNQVETHTTE